MVDHLFQRQQQHAAHRNPAGNNHRDHQQHHRRKDPQNAFVVAFIVLDTFGGQRGLRLTPLAINLLHRGLLLFGILFEHIFQIALPQQNVHLRQRGGVDAVLLFQAIGQVLVHTRRFRQRVVFIVMGLGIGQQVFRGIDQLVQLPAVNLRRHAALQAQHAAVESDARLVQADPGVGKLRDVLAGKLRNGEVLFIVIECVNENAGGDQLHDAEHKQHRNQKSNDFYTFKHALPFLYTGIV